MPDIEKDREVWFPAKTYGWGWGMPVKWQGWVVIAVYTILLVAGFFLFPPTTNEAGFLIYQFLLAGGLVAVCWLKGEEPRWRWGGK